MASTEWKVFLRMLTLVVCISLAALPAVIDAQARPSQAASAQPPADSPGASACAEGALIGAAVAIAGALAIDVLGGAGIATTLTAKLLVPALVTGCVGDALHDALRREKQEKSASKEATAVTRKPQAGNR